MQICFIRTIQRYTNTKTFLGYNPGGRSLLLDSVVPFVQQLRSPLTLDELRALQSQDNKCTTLIRMLKNGKLDPVAYSLQEGVLYR